MARVLRVDGSEEELGFHPLLEVLQKAVGGLIEVVPLVRQNQPRMYCNEEGRLEGLPANPFASLIAGQVLLGDVVILTAEDWKARNE